MRRAGWWAAVALIATQLVVRGLVLARGGFYWDDLILVGRAGQYPLLSGSFLLYNHDGHFMPGAFLIAGVVTRLCGAYVWWPAAVSLLVLQALASLAVWRLLRILLGDRPAVPVLLAGYLFGALTLPSFAWWAAGLNAVPLQAGLAWVAGDALRLAETGRARYAVRGVLVFVLALACFEKALVVPFVAAAIVALRYRGEVRAALRRCWRLWFGSTTVIAVWTVGYLAVVRVAAGPSAEDRASIGDQAGGLVWHGLSRGLLPALLGGPLRWERWLPGPPWADPPTALIVAGWLAVGVALAGTLYARRGAAAIWCVGIGYVAASQAAMVLARSGPGTTFELAQTLRYVADSSVVIVAALALLIRAPVRRPVRIPPATVVVASGCFVVIGLVSTVTFARSWHEDRTTDYLTTARTALSGQREPVLDQPVPPRVLAPVAYPNNLASHVFAAVRPGPVFGTSTPELRMFDDNGRLIPAVVAPVRAVVDGPEPRCGHRVDVLAVLPLTGPLAEWEWTVELNYLAARDGVVLVSLTDGPTVRVPVVAGLHQAYVRLTGSGDGLRVQPVTAGLDLCVARGPVGGVLPG